MPQGASPAPVPAPQVGDSGSSDSDNDYQDARLQQSDDAAGTSAAQTPAASSQEPPDGNRPGASKSNGNNPRLNQSVVLAPGVMQRMWGATKNAFTETARARYCIPPGWATKEVVWDISASTTRDAINRAYNAATGNEFGISDQCTALGYVTTVSQITKKSTTRPGMAYIHAGACRAFLQKVAEANVEGIKPSVVLQSLVCAKLRKIERAREAFVKASNDAERVRCTKALKKHEEKLGDLCRLCAKIREKYTIEWKKLSRMERSQVNEDFPPWEIEDSRLWRAIHTDTRTFVLQGLCMAALVGWEHIHNGVYNLEATQVAPVVNDISQWATAFHRATGAYAKNVTMPSFLSLDRTPAINMLYSADNSPVALGIGSAVNVILAIMVLRLLYLFVLRKFR